MKKRILIVMLSALMAVSLAACGVTSSNENNAGSQPEVSISNKDAQPGSPSGISENEPADGNTESESSEEVSEKTNILIVYFSRVGITPFSKDVDAISSASLVNNDSELIGNTTIIANMIHDTVGGDLFQIMTVKSYPVDYDETTDVAQQEQRDNARPELSTHVEDMDTYDVIFLGYPNWWGTIPMPVFTFLEEYDFSGKTIIPFCTHEGSRLGSSVSDIAALCPDAILLDGLAIRGSNVSSAQNDVADWLREVGMAG